MGTVPGSGMVLGADVGCLLGKSGRDNQAQIPALVREREKEGEKKKEKEAKKKKKKRLSFIMRLSAMGRAG